MPFGTTPVFNGDGLQVVNLGSPPAYDDQSQYSGRSYDRSNSNSICTYVCGLLAIGSGSACAYGVTTLLFSDDAKQKIHIMLACVLADIVSVSMAAIGVIAIANECCCQDRGSRREDDEEEPLIAATR